MSFPSLAYQPGLIGKKKAPTENKIYQQLEDVVNNKRSQPIVKQLNIQGAPVKKNKPNDQVDEPQLVQQAFNLDNQKELQLRQSQLRQHIQLFKQNISQGLAPGDDKQTVQNRYKQGEISQFARKQQNSMHNLEIYIRNCVRQLAFSYLLKIKQLMKQSKQFSLPTGQQIELNNIVGQHNVLIAIRNPIQFFSKHALIGKQAKYPTFAKLAFDFHKFMSIAKNYIIVQGDLIQKRKIHLQLAFTHQNENQIMIPTKSPNVYLRVNKDHGQTVNIQKAIYKSGQFIQQQKLNFIHPQTKTMLFNIVKRFLQSKKMFNQNSPQFEKMIHRFISLEQDNHKSRQQNEFQQQR